MFKLSVHHGVTVTRQKRSSVLVYCTDYPTTVPRHINCFKRLKPLVFCEVEVALDIQQHLLEESQPLLLKLLALFEHLLHVFHVVWGAITQLLQSLLILLLRLDCNTHMQQTL